MWLQPAEWEALWLSLRVAAAATVLVAVPGVVLGWLLARKRFRGRLLLDGLVHLPLVLTPVVVGYLMLLIVGRQGLLGGALEAAGIQPVSYTHLTLPTIYSV